MVHFITGPVGAGKSTKLLRIYESMHSGDEFYNVRCYKGGETIGQDIVHMQSGNRIPFSRVEDSIPENWDEEVRFMNYSFSKKGFEFAGNIINIIAQNNLQTAFIDELGPLEIQKEGLYVHFSRLLRRNIDLYVVCRDTCINKIIDLFSISNFTIE